MSRRIPAGRLATAGLLCACLAAAGCIKERCSEHRDCPDQKLCNAETGECYYECSEDTDCGGDRWFYCEDHTCRFRCEAEALSCPDDMASICGSFCIDVHEASRPDADAASAGADGSMATSRAGVLPWTSGTLTAAEAAAACEAAGKRLCTGPEWEAACAGISGRVYTYADEYEPTTCNSRDTFCDPDCGVYPECYRDCPYENLLMPTGSFPGCTNSFGVFDMSGNTWEAIRVDDGADHFRGGAHDCGDPRLAHQCGFDAVAVPGFPATRGFRCCADGDPP